MAVFLLPIGQKILRQHGTVTKGIVAERGTYRKVKRKINLIPGFSHDIFV
jgi:hypothetical protein